MISNPALFTLTRMRKSQRQICGAARAGMPLQLDERLQRNKHSCCAHPPIGGCIPWYRQKTR